MTSIYAPQPQPVTPELLEEGHYQLALDATLHANCQPGMYAEAIPRRIHTGADSDYLPAYYVASPTAPPNCTYSREDVQAVTQFFNAIIGGQVEAVRLLLNSGMDVECRDRRQRDMTPLYAAVRAEQSRMMFLLINAGADVNKFSGDPDITQPCRNTYDKGDFWLKRTPLMRAAQNGNLRMVKDLIEQCNADPMAIAPDGQSAQRLAAKAGHRNIVEYLPVNRGGIGKRLLYDYHTRYHKIRYLFKTIYSILKFSLWSVPKFFVWSVPKFFLWSIPKCIIEELLYLAGQIYSALPPVRTWPSLIWAAIVDVFKAIGRGSKAVARGATRAAKSIRRGTARIVKGIPKVLKACYNGTKRVGKAIPDVTIRAAKAIGRTTIEIGRWIWDFLKACYNATKRFVRAIPHMTVRAGKAIGRTTMGVGRWTWNFLKACYGASKRLLKAIPGMAVRVVKAIGRTIMEIGRWIWKLMKRIGDAVVDIVKAIADVFATLYFYLESLIKHLRAVKFKDIVRAVQRVLHAIFVAFPKALWEGLKTAVGFIDSMLTCLTLGLWWLVSRLAEWIVRGICFIPEQILRILLITIQGIGKLFTELWLLINPRSMM